jgi:dCMP deaminase
VTLDLGRYRKFLPIVRAYANLSKDESSKVGALIIGPGMEHRAQGWNGAPRGSDADVDDRRQRPEKYFWFSHAESNAIANAARAGTSTQGCVMLVTMPPCMDCAKLIVQAGIKAVVYVAPNEEFKERWKDHIGRAAMLFAECGVETLEIEDRGTEPMGYICHLDSWSGSPENADWVAVRMPAGAKEIPEGAPVYLGSPP